MSHPQDCLKGKKSINSEDAQILEECSESHSRSHLHAVHNEGGEKRSQNGDIYVGSCRLGVPDGLGKYLWANGCMYEGDWISGKATGRGKMSWPSGATYDGEFSGGNMHGVGTFIGHNMTYKGNWVMNAEHGLGRKVYANGDVYEGLWKKGVQDGLGRYTWKNGNVYFGDWKKGKIFGKGLLTWASTDSYDGLWQDGRQHGRGMYTWADGSCYIGTWTKGKKDGKGTLYPPSTKTLHKIGSDSSLSQSIESKNIMTFPALRHLHTMRHPIPSVLHKFEKIMHSLRRSRSWPLRRAVADKRWSLDGLHYMRTNDVAGFKMVGTSDSVCDYHEQKRLLVLEREYAQGVLISEFEKDGTSVERGILQHRYATGHSQNVGETIVKGLRYPTGHSQKVGETIVKGHRSYHLMLNLQLGIRYSIARSNQRLDLEPLPSDFSLKAKKEFFFPRKGSQKTPPHDSVDFKWIDYCPMVFRKIRQMFKINEVDYLMSLCGNDALRELSSPGKSGSIFYLSNDDRYMIKTLRGSEVKVLLRMIQNYYGHLCKHAETLITKIFGLYQVAPAGGKKTQVVVMGNVFCTELRIHRKFDLKGSLQGRSSKTIEMDESVTLKDLDLDCDFLLEPSWRLAFFEQVRKDCHFLKSENIMDYSLLLGVHFRAPGGSEFLDSSVSETGIAEENRVQTLQEASPPRSLALVAHSEDGINPSPHVRGSSLKMETIGHQEVDLLILGTNLRLQIQLGVNMPAVAVCRHPKAVVAAADSEGVDINEVYDVIIYFGILDILQNYGLGKKIEHLYKAIKYGSDLISVVNPHFYAQRFEEFIHRFFPPSL